MNVIELYGHSDDVQMIEIFEDKKNVYNDEHYNYRERDKSYNLNDDVEFNIVHTERGWQVRLLYLNEETNKDLYDISIVNSGNKYSPMLRIETELDICIDGIYGDKKIKIRDRLEEEFYSVLDKDKATEIINFLSKEGYLKFEM